MHPPHGKTPPPVGCDPEVVKTRSDAICTGPRSIEVMKYGEEKRREERRNRREERSIDHFSSSPEFRNSIDPFPPLPSLGLQFLLICTPKLIRHPTCHPVPHSWFISRRGSYFGAVHFSAWFMVGIIRMVELLLMNWHRWELPVPAKFIAIGDHQSYTSIE